MNGIEDKEVPCIKFDLVDATGRGWWKVKRNTYKAYIGDFKAVVFPDACSNPGGGWNFCWFDKGGKKSLRSVYCSKEVACKAASEYLEAYKA